MDRMVQCHLAWSPAGSFVGRIPDGHPRIATDRIGLDGFGSDTEHSEILFSLHVHLAILYLRR